MFLVLIAFICGGFVFFVGHSLESKWSISYDTSQIVSGIFASGILAVLVYIIKSVLTKYLLTSESHLRTGRSDEQMLLPAEIHA